MRDRALLAVRIGATINESDARRFERVLEEVQGRWVAWCVEHDAAKGRRTGPVWNVCEWRMGNPWPSGKCVWHPQGAFVPDEGNMKVTKH